MRILNQALLSRTALISFLMPLLFIHSATAQDQRIVEDQKVFTIDTLLMGSAFSFSAIHANTDSSYMAVRSAIDEVARIEEMISSWSDMSETSEINRNAGIRAVKVSPELYALIRRSLKVSKLSKGAFDITFQPAKGYWQFDRTERPLPDSSMICESLRHIGFRHIELLAGSRVYLNDSSIRISFGAIGKGYAANRAKAEMERFGVSGGLVNAGGDILSFGQGPQDGKWPVVVSNPVLPSQYVARVSVSGLAVVTSGDYEKYFTSNGKRYPHILDPRTGWPAIGLSSVSVFCPDAELADALSTAIFVLGVNDGLALVDQLMMVECFIIDNEGNKFYSKGLGKNRQ